jgi:hypothetical protein
VFSFTGGGKMDLATLRQKEFIRQLFLKHGFRWRNLNPLEFWEISREEASDLINDLKVLQRHYSSDLRDMICQSTDGKHIIHNIARTIEELEDEEEELKEEQEELPEYPAYDGNLQEIEWAGEWYPEALKKYLEVVA